MRSANRLLPIALAAAIAVLLGVVPVAWCGPDPDGPAVGPVAAAPADDLDREERLLVGHRAFVENCLMCHAEELTARSRLTPTQWAAEVDQMIGWVPEQGPLLDYLVGHFTDPATSPIPPLALITPRRPRPRRSRRSPAGRGRDAGRCAARKDLPAPRHWGATLGPAWSRSPCSCGRPTSRRSCGRACAGCPVSRPF
ncbi:MAG: hypothetical protein WKF75_03435 [Singulisphaera sp.]